jgi:hypothetical protein
MYLYSRTHLIICNHPLFYVYRTFPKRRNMTSVVVKEIAKTTGLAKSTIRKHLRAEVVDLGLI